MTGTEIALIIGALAALVTAVGTAFVMIHTALRTLKSKVEEIHKQTNSMKDALVEAVGKAERSAGKEEERVEERERVAVALAAPVEVEIVNEPENPVPVHNPKPAVKKEGKTK